MMNYEPLNRELEKFDAFPTRFSEIRSGMKEKFGEHGWIGKFVTASKGLTPADGRAYQSARKQVERWNSFEKTGKYNPDKAKGAGQAQIAAAGKALDPVGKAAPREGVTVTITFKDGSAPSGHRRADRETPALHMDSKTATEWMNQTQPDYAFLFNLWGPKRIGDSLFGEDGAYPADIVSVSVS